MHVLVCMIIQEVAGMCLCGGVGVCEEQKLLAKYGLFQLRSAVYTSGRFPHSLLSLLSLCWMCHLSSIHHVAVYAVLLSTSPTRPVLSTSTLAQADQGQTERSKDLKPPWPCLTSVISQKQSDESSPTGHSGGIFPSDDSSPTTGSPQGLSPNGWLVCNNWFIFYLLEPGKGLMIDLNCDSLAIEIHFEIWHCPYHCQGSPSRWLNNSSLMGRAFSSGRSQGALPTVIFVA